MTPALIFFFFTEDQDFIIHTNHTYNKITIEHINLQSPSYLKYHGSDCLAPRAVDAHPASQADRDRTVQSGSDLLLPINTGPSGCPSRAAPSHLPLALRGDERLEPLRHGGAEGARGLHGKRDEGVALTSATSWVILCILRIALTVLVV